MRLAVAILALGALAGCRAPTEIVVELTTDIKCSDLKGVEIRVGPVSGLDSRLASASTDSCKPSGRIGSVVLVPSGGRSDEVAVEVVAGFGRKVEECRKPFGPGCIVERRALRYVPHTPLHLSIPLKADCNGVACDETTTCRNGECVDNHIPDPSSCTSGCGEGELKPTGPHITAGCGDMRGLQAGAAWPMSNYCPTRGGHSPFSGPTGTASASSDTSYLGTPLIAADGTIFIGSKDGYVHALGDIAGTPLWSTRVGTGQVFVELLGAHGSVDYGTNTGVFGAVDMKTHKNLWAAANVYSQDSAPVVDGEGRIILVGPKGFVHAIDGGTGSSLWNYQPQGATAGGSIGPDGTVYIAESGFLYALDPQNGKPRWHAALPGPSEPSLPVITDQGLVVVAGPEGTRAFDLNGKMKWNADPGADLVAVGSDGTLFLPEASAIVALDPASGKPLWSANFTAATTPVVDADGKLFVAGISGNTIGLEPTSGKQVWSAQPGGTGLQFGGGITADHRFVVGSVLGGIYAAGP